MRTAKRKPPTVPTPKTKPDRRREPRRRVIPRWLTGNKDLDEVAQRRTLLILSVLSGHQAVTTAIAEHGISRPLYYQLETKGLIGMMRALVPGANATTSPGDATPGHQIHELEQKVARLEQETRRLERLLFMAKKVLPAGPLAFPQKRGRKPGRRSTNAGPGPSPTSKRSTTPAMAPVAASTPTTAGASTP